MSDNLGFVSNTEHLSARSEPKPYITPDRPNMTVQGTSKCKCGKTTFMRYCITHKAHEWFEEVKTFRGSHEVSGKPRIAWKDKEHRGSYEIHSCVAISERVA